MNILLAGDTHGNFMNLEMLVDLAQAKSCEQIFVLGDFGYFPNFQSYKIMIDKISNKLVNSSIVLFFLAGNHEDWFSLRLMTERNKFHEINPNIFYSPTGNVFEINGTRIMTVGGAYSIDKKYRTFGVDWFPDEELTILDYNYCSDQGEVDILLTHDCPESIHIPNLLPIPEAMKNREVLDNIYKEAKPKKLFHGHYHMKLESFDETMNCNIVGLNCNLNYPNQTYILSL